MDINKDTKLLKQVSWDVIHEIIRGNLDFGSSYPHGIDLDIKEIREYDVEEILYTLLMFHDAKQRGFALCSLECDRIDE